MFLLIIFLFRAPLWGFELAVYPVTKQIENVESDEARVSRRLTLFSTFVERGLQNFFEKTKITLLTYCNFEISTDIIKDCSVYRNSLQKAIPIEPGQEFSSYEEVNIGSSSDGKVDLEFVAKKIMDLYTPNSDQIFYIIIANIFLDSKSNFRGVKIDLKNIVDDLNNHMLKYKYTSLIENKDFSAKLKIRFEEEKKKLLDTGESRYFDFILFGKEKMGTMIIVSHSLTV